MAMYFEYRNSQDKEKTISRKGHFTTDSLGKGGEFQKYSQVPLHPAAPSMAWYYTLWPKQSTNEVRSLTQTPPYDTALCVLKLLRA